VATKLVGKVLTVLVSVTLVGCGGGAGGTTTTVGGAEGDSTTTPSSGGETTSTTLVAAPTTTAPTASTAADEGTVDIEDIPPACVDVIRELLLAFEPAVKDIDWEQATIEDHLQVITALAGVSIGDTSGCEDVQLDVTDEEGTALFFAVAEREAPGAVGYFKAIMEINAALDGKESTGDCQTDIATFEEFVAGGVPWVDLPLPEQWLVLNLMGSIGFCSLQTQGELMFRDETQAFLAGSPFAGG
jgi:hypothetical protein